MNTPQRSALVRRRCTIIPPWSVRRALSVTFAAVMLLASAAAAQPAGTAVPLACGGFVTRVLPAGAVDLVAPIESGLSKILVEVTDSSRTLGSLKLESTNLGPSNETCSGFLMHDPGRSRGDAIAVSDCLDDDAGEYTIGFNVVSDGPDHCGRSFAGAVTVQGEIERAGDVDPYIVESTGDGRIELAASPGEGSEVGTLRLRLFDPEGEQVADSCSASIDEEAEHVGRYTILASACDGVSVGSYHIERIGAPSVAASPPGELVYVLNAETGNIGVIEPDRGVASTSIQLVDQVASEDPNPLVVSPTQGFVYAFLPEMGRIFTVETASNRLRPAIPGPVLDAPLLPLVAHPSGTELLASAPRLGGIARINLASGHIVGVIPVAAIDDQGIAVSPDGNTAYATTSPPDGSEAIAVVDLVAGSVTNSIAKSSQVDAELVTTPDGKQLWSYGHSSIVIVDTATLVVRDTIPIHILGVAFHPTEPVAYATGWSAGDQSAVLVIDMESLAVSGTILLPGVDTPFGVSLSRNLHHLYITDLDASFDPTSPRDRSPGLVVVDVESEAIIARYSTLGTMPSAVVAVTPPQGLCTADEVAQSKVTVGELVTSVRFAVDGCPDEPSVPPLDGIPGE
jgi:DNA-binding beta-propeller fold protein YncE